jgi:hypothetical protein
MGETEQINFIARHIDAKLSLSRLANDEPVAFLNAVDAFCLDCKNRLYYSDEDDVAEYYSENRYSNGYYDDDWDYDEYYKNSEWAKIFSRMFMVSMMYMRSGDIATGYESCARLLSCFTESVDGGQYFGADEPDTYIDVDWLELFQLFYSVMFRYHADVERAIETAFRYFVYFGERCMEGFLEYVKDIDIAERYIISGIKNTDDWGAQCSYFNLLESLCSHLGMGFDKVSKAKILLETNVYFFLQVVEGLSDQGNWHAVVDTASHALTMIQTPQITSTYGDIHNNYQRTVQQQIRAAIQTKLADAYGKLENYEQEFGILFQMFHEKPGYELYIRARFIAEKIMGVPAYLEKIEAELAGKPRENAAYGLRSLLLNIYSYEGEAKKMLAMVQSPDNGHSYYDRKYAALSLIYRALEGVGEVGPSIPEYLANAAGQDGIIGMANRGCSMTERRELLISGADLLKDMVAFHIDAAKRSRYAKAAYYMCVIRDVYSYIQGEDEFRSYLSYIMAQNSRRHALRDEMKVVYR